MGIFPPTFYYEKFQAYDKIEILLQRTCIYPPLRFYHFYYICFIVYQSIYPIHLIFWWTKILKMRLYVMKNFNRPLRLLPQNFDWWGAWTKSLETISPYSVLSSPANLLSKSTSELTAGNSMSPHPCLLFKLSFPALFKA